MKTDLAMFFICGEENRLHCFCSAPSDLGKQFYLYEMGCRRHLAEPDRTAACCVRLWAGDYAGLALRGPLVIFRPKPLKRGRVMPSALNRGVQPLSRRT